MKQIIKYFCVGLMICIGLVLVNPQDAFASQSGDWEYELTNNQVTITGYYGAGGNVNIPSSLGGYSVTSIGNNAFYGCYSLTSVTIPNSVTSIGNSAFYLCTSLTSITIPNSVTSISNNAFSACTSLTSITIPNSVTSISNSAFSACTSLTSITIPNSVTSISNSAFSACTGLTSITIPNSVTSIGDNAFQGCSSLTSITIPNSVTSIGHHAFSGCTSLMRVGLPNPLPRMGVECFNYTPYQVSILSASFDLEQVRKGCERAANNALAAKDTAQEVYDYVNGLDLGNEINNINSKIESLSIPIVIKVSTTNGATASTTGQSPLITVTASGADQFGLSLDGITWQDGFDIKTGRSIGISPGVNNIRVRAYDSSVPADKRKYAYGNILIFGLSK